MMVRPSSNRWCYSNLPLYYLKLHGDVLYDILKGTSLGQIGVNSNVGPVNMPWFG